MKHFEETITTSKVSLSAEHSALNEKSILELGLYHREDHGCENGYESWEWVKHTLIGVKQIGKIDLSIKGEMTDIKRLYVQNKTGVKFVVEQLACMGANFVNVLPASAFKH